MTRKRRSFSSEFKLEAASLVLDQGYSIAEAGRSLASALLVVAQTFERRRKMRRDLLSLDASQLRDVGLTRDEALRAAERIEWRGDWS